MAKVIRSRIIADEVIVTKIYLIRRQKVMLDEDLAELYQVPTSRLNEQVKRNIARFPEDFMFQLTKEEFAFLISQNATSSWGGRRKLPYAFTEHGVLMLSSILTSKRAISVNIQIMRIYSKMREMLLTNQEILLKLEQVEKRITGHDKELQLVFGYLKKLLIPPNNPDVVASASEDRERMADFSLTSQTASRHTPS